MSYIELKTSLNGRQIVITEERPIDIDAQVWNFVCLLKAEGFVDQTIQEALASAARNVSCE